MPEQQEGPEISKNPEAAEVFTEIITAAREAFSGNRYTTEVLGEEPDDPINPTELLNKLSALKWEQESYPKNKLTSIDPQGEELVALVRKNPPNYANIIMGKQRLEIYINGRTDNGPWKARIEQQHPSGVLILASILGTQDSSSQ